MKTIVSHIELLEVRIAPAALFVNSTTATFTDEDGDLVTVKFTKPILTPDPGGNVNTVLGTTANGLFNHLDTINLVGVAGAAGTGISVMAKIHGNGDGLVNVGHINSDVDLGAVTIKGDLNEIDAGDTANTATPGLKSLSVRSYGAVAYLAGGAPATSTIHGGLGALKVTTDFIGANLDVSGNPVESGTIGSITIGGTLGGLTTQLSGTISATGNIGNVKIGGSVFGGSGSDSGEVYSSKGKIGNITVGGTVHGGTAENAGGFSADKSIGAIKIGHDLLAGSVSGVATLAGTGSIYAGTGITSITIGGSVVGGSNGGGTIDSDGVIGPVKIGRDIVGGSPQSGLVFSSVELKTVTLGGSLIGGTGSQSGLISSAGNIGLVKIGGDVRGGGTSAATDHSGLVGSQNGSVAGVTIGGDGVAGVGAFDGAILAQTSLGPVKIGGNIFSNASGKFTISAQGTAAKPLAIASLTITGGARNLLVLAGYTIDGTASLRGASIGAVKVGGNWQASSIAAGVRNSGNPNFGDANDALINGAVAAISKIASIAIGGLVAGSVGGSDAYGLVAQKIGSVKVGGTTVPLDPTLPDNRALGLTGDFHIHEVLAAV